MKRYTTIASLLFGLGAIVHVCRLLFHVEVVIAGFQVPMWVSLLGALIAVVVAIGLRREAKA